MLQISTKGLDEVQGFLKALRKLGSIIKAAELNAKDRKDSDATNAQILEWQKDQGRDWISEDDEMNKAIEKAMSDSFQESFDKITLKTMAKNPSGLASSIASKGFYTAMDAAKKIVTERIEGMKGANGSTIEPIDPNSQYGKQKQEDHGFVNPPGKATGQLLDNLAPGIRNIKLRK